MRPTIVIAASVGIGVVAVVGTRLAGSLGHVTTIASTLPASSVSTGHESASPAPTIATRLEAAIAGFASQTDAEDPAIADEPAPTSTSASDEQIMDWLAADPVLKRAADELLRDPDPEVRLDAQQFLREIGVAVPADDRER